MKVVFLLVTGSIFQGIVKCEDVCVDTDSIYRIDVNGNGCDWYNEEGNEVECGDHDGYYPEVNRPAYEYFEAYEDCCVCKYRIDVCADTDSNYRIDVNGNGCNWYNEEDNVVECGDHDGYYPEINRPAYEYFEAYEDCCVCKNPSDQYYVDDGCHSEADSTQDDMTGSFQPKDSYNAFIRCCSEDGTECTTITDDCTESMYATTYDDATSQCESQGLRLCTKTELLTDVCCGTGGSCDSYAIWTSTSAELIVASAALRWIFVEEETCSNYRTDKYSSFDVATAECTLDNTCGGITENNEDYKSGYYLCDYGTFYDFPLDARSSPDKQVNVYKKASCEDGLWNSDEDGVDCGGNYCDACITCSDGLLNGDEEDIDCGGPDCDECAYCDDGLWNGDEDGIDCGGSKGCAACRTISFNIHEDIECIEDYHCGPVNGPSVKNGFVCVDNLCYGDYEATTTTTEATTPCNLRMSGCEEEEEEATRGPDEDDNCDPDNARVNC